MEKVKLPQNVVDALDHYRSEYLSDYEAVVMNTIFDKSIIPCSLDRHERSIVDYEREHEGNCRNLIRAMVLGYEPIKEATKREKVNELLQKWFGYPISDKLMDQIEEIYGIKPE